MTKPTRHRLRINDVPKDRDVNGYVLVLPGGKPTSMARSHAWQLANVRIELLARGLRASLGDGVEVRRLQYRFRGWNAGSLDALHDARAALDDIRTTVDAKNVVVVGHSMGGRVAAHLAASGDVGAVAALAPWWPSSDADLIPTDCRLLTMHGTADTWTDPAASQAQTVRALARGVDARWVPVDGAGHFLMRNFTLWHRMVADFAMAQWSESSQA